MELPPWPKTSSPRVLKVAKTFLDQEPKLNFAVAAKNPNYLSEFGLSDSNSDAPLITIKTSKGAKYAMKETFS